jgi:uncharacterized protein (DUF433 family)
MYEGLITVDPNICHGKPCIKGTRIMVSNILSQLAGGYDFEKIKQGYPELTDDHIRAAIEYAAAVVEGEDVYLVPAK